jgi:hypothetical protein
MGSVIEVYFVLQFCLILYYGIKHDRPEHLARMKLYQ